MVSPSLFKNVKFYDFQQKIDSVPTPLEDSEDQKYLVEMRKVFAFGAGKVLEVNLFTDVLQELRSAMRNSAFFIHPPEKRKDIDRYSDKYHNASETKTIELGKSFINALTH